MRFTQSSLSRLRTSLAALTLVALTAGTAHAQYVTLTPTSNVTLYPYGTAPGNVTQGKHQDDTNVTAFYEKQNVIFTGKFDISAQGTYGPGGASYPAAGSGGGTNQLVDSFFFYSDPKAASKTFMGNIVFNSQILGLEVISSSLDTTDSSLGFAGTIYPHGVNSRGLETNADTITWSGNTVSWNVFDTSTSVDEVRVITAAVPEPTAALPMGLMLLGSLVLWRRRPARSGQAA